LHAVVGFKGVADELTLGSLQSTYGYSTVQRTGDGKVKVFLPDLIAFHEKNAWTVKPYSRHMSRPLRRLGMPPAAQNLLDLAVHVLSPSNVGATLVMSTPDELVGPGIMAKRTAVEPLVAEPRSYGAIRSLAAQHDRAMAFDIDGRLLAYDIELTCDDDHRDLIVGGGTRHNSAARASASQPEILVVVVSSDGPVSVFLQGERIANFEQARWFVPCTTCDGIGTIPADVPDTDEPAPPVNCATCAGTGKLWESEPIYQPPVRKSAPPRRPVAQLIIES
jgi:DNA integrity scanning protein DisA with diadenylate cyclase activity